MVLFPADVTSSWIDALHTVSILVFRGVTQNSLDNSDFFNPSFRDQATDFYFNHIILISFLNLLIFYAHGFIFFFSPALYLLTVANNSWFALLADALIVTLLPFPATSRTNPATGVLGKHLQPKLACIRSNCSPAGVGECFRRAPSEGVSGRGKLTRGQE